MKCNRSVPVGRQPDDKRWPRPHFSCTETGNPRPPLSGKATKLTRVDTTKARMALSVNIIIISVQERGERERVCSVP